MGLVGEDARTQGHWRWNPGTYLPSNREVDEEPHGERGLNSVWGGQEKCKHHKCDALAVF